MDIVTLTKHTHALLFKSQTKGIEHRYLFKF